MSLQADHQTADPSTELRAELAADTGGHLPALDGLRGIGVVFVMGYHHGFGWAKGGFLAVSMFFTLSGFLVTWLALREWGRDGRLSVTGFLERRARRLLPGAFVTLVFVMIFGVVAADAAQRDRLSWDVIASATYWANWRAYLSGNHYFDGFVESSPVEHFWSLSIEEQFYLLFPFLAGAVFRAMRQGRDRAAQVERRWLTGAIWGLAGLAAVWTAAAYAWWGPERSYLGTDTRAAEILLGVGLACAITGRRSALVARRWLGVLAGLGALMWIAFMTSVSSDLAFVYRGGLALTGIATMAMILAELAGLSVMAPFRLGLPVWLGQRSYGIYLLHFPIFMWVDSDVTSATGWSLFALRMIVVIPAAALMYILVEEPIRRRRLFPDTNFLWLAPPLIAACVIAALVIPFPTLGPSSLTGSRIAMGASQDELTVPESGTNEPPTVAERPKVLVISLDPNDPVTAELLDGSVDPSIDYLDGGDFWCANDICGPWWQRWPNLVRETDADAVLLVMRDFGVTPDLLTKAGAPEPPTRSWVSERLGVGVDAVTDLGVPVTAATLTKRNLMRTVELDLDPAEVAAIEGTFDFTIETPSLQAVELPDDATAASVASEAVSARLDDEHLTVMVMGDSMGGGVAEGLQRWVESRGDLSGVAIWDSTRAGCGLFALAYRDADAGCQELTSTLIERLNAVHPDVVVVVNSSSELVVHRLDGRSVQPGDGLYDLAMISVYDEWMERFRALGARVVWFNAPCMGQGAADMFAVDTDDIDTFNRGAFRVFLDRNPDVQFFDANAALCPEGTFVGELGNLDNARPDGMHLSEAGALWFAETYGGEILHIGGD